MAAALLTASLLFALYRASSGSRLGEIRFGAAEWLMVDFHTVVYYPARAFADGLNPYDTPSYQARYPAPLAFRGYPPAILAASQPFAMLSLRQAMAVQVALTLVLSAALGWVCLRLERVRPDATAVIAFLGILLLTRPGHWTLLLGQLTIVMVIAGYLALTLPARKAGWSGLALALTMLKPTFGIPLAIFMVVLRRWRALLVGVAVTGVVNLLVLAVLASRSGGYRRAIDLITSGGEGVDASDIVAQSSVFRIDAIAALSRLAGHSLGRFLPFLIAGLVLGIAAYGLRRRRDASSDALSDATSAGLAFTAVLFCVYHNSYDLLLLAWPATALIMTRIRLGYFGPRERLQSALYLVLAFNYLSTFTVLEAIGFDSPLALPIVSINSIALAGLFATYAWPTPASAPRPG